MATITLREITTKTIIGFWEAERLTPQPVIFTIWMDVDEKKAAKEDDVAYSVDYSVVVNKILAEVPKTKFNLIEALAHFVLDLVLAHEGVKKAKVELVKPEAPLENTNGVSITVKGKPKKK
jgi:dihydroneopterin aldolase